MLESCNYTELKVFGAVLVNTLGRTKPETWAEISDEQFDEATGVTKEWWTEALEMLTAYRPVYGEENGKPKLRAGKTIIRTRKSPTSGRIQYALTENLATETKALTVRGKCEACHAVGAFETEFIPVPHAVFRKLGAGLDHSSYVCLMTIIRHSLKWTGERGVWGEPVQLEIDDFERATNLERRQITSALSKLCDPNGWALVARTERPGRPALYRPIPERFGKIDRREARVVVQPLNRQKKANTTPKVEVETTNKTTEKPDETRANESPLHCYAFCKSCGHYGAVEPCEEDTGPVERPESAARAGPIREKRKKPSKFQTIAESLSRKYAGNA